MKLTKGKKELNTDKSMLFAKLKPGSHFSGKVPNLLIGANGYHLIQTLVPDKDGKIAIEAVLIEAKYLGMSEAQVDTVLEELARQKMIALGRDYVKF